MLGRKTPSMGAAASAAAGKASVANDAAPARFKTSRLLAEESCDIATSPSRCGPGEPDRCGILPNIEDNCHRVAALNRSCGHNPARLRRFHLPASRSPDEAAA